MPMNYLEPCIYDIGGPNPFFVRVKVNGKNVTGARPNISSARVLRAEFIAQRSRGTVLDPHLGRVTVEEFAETWLAAREGINIANTNARLESAFRLHVFPVMGSRRLAATKPLHVEHLISQLLTKPCVSSGRPLSHSTAKVIYFNVASLFKAAVRNDYLTKSPFAGIMFPRPPKSELVEPLEPEHVAIIAAEMYDYLKGAVLFAAATGLRPGELFGLALNAKQIDLKQRSLHVHQQIQTPRNGGGAYLCRPKYGSDRTIPLSDAAIGILEAHLEAHGTHTFEIPWGDPPRDGEADGRKMHTPEMVFASFTFRDPELRQQGKVWSPMRRRQMGFAWEMATANYAFPSSGWHALRHFHASVLIEGGESIIAVQHRLGHSSAKVTLDTYGHLFKENFDKTRQVVDEVMATVLGPQLRCVS